MFFLVGAESERKSLEKLLHRRAEFTGQPLDAFQEGSTSFSTSSATHSDRKAKKIIGFGKDMAVTYGIGKKSVILRVTLFRSVLFIISGVVRQDLIICENEDFLGRKFALHQFFINSNFIKMMKNGK